MTIERQTVAFDEQTLAITWIFDAPRDLVFRCWTEAEHTAHWFAPKDFTLPFSEAEVVEGGPYRVRQARCVPRTLRGPSPLSASR